MDPQTLARLALLSAILAVSANGASVSNSTPARATPVPNPGTAETYVVQAGDTLYAIALKYNTTIAALQQANNIADPAALSIGTRLLIPGVVAQNVATPSPTARGPTTTPAPGASPPPHRGRTRGR